MNYFTVLTKGKISLECKKESRKTKMLKTNVVFAGSKILASPVRENP